MSIIATIIGIAILGLKVITKKILSPRCTYIIWMIFVIALIFPVTVPSKISIYNYIDISGIKVVENNSSNETINLIDDIKNNDLIIKDNSKVINTQSGLPENYVKSLIAIAWFFVFVIKVIGVIYSYKVFVDAVGYYEIDDKRINEILERCKKELKIKREIKLIEQDLIKTPATIGIFDIKIIFTDMVYDLSDDALIGVIMHELAHYKRRDNIINMLSMVLKCVYWFNPFIKKCFNILKTDLEAATDEMAVGTMDENEYGTYCRVMIEVAGKYTEREERILGMASGKENIEARVDMIFKIRDLKKFTIPITILTGIIILLVCMVLYPTSYGMISSPEVYLKSENGQIIELVNIDETKEFKYNTIKLNKNEKVKLLVESGKPEKYIYYSKIETDSLECQDKNIKFYCDKLIYFETGENLYKFVVQYGNDKIATYVAKVVVE